MSEREYSVTVAVERGGRVEQIRVGTAVQDGEGFVLRLGELRIQGQGQPVAAPSWASPDGAAARRTSPIAGPESGGLTLPNYGRSKGQPIAGATEGDLEYYAAGCRRTLGDSSKARWHDKEKVLLAAIEAELVRQRGMPPMSPPASSSSSFGGGGAFDDERPPPPGDDDIPF